MERRIEQPTRREPAAGSPPKDHANASTSRRQKGVTDRNKMKKIDKTNEMVRFRKRPGHRSKRVGGNTFAPGTSAVFVDWRAVVPSPIRSQLDVYGWGTLPIKAQSEQPRATRQTTQNAQAILSSRCMALTLVRNPVRMKDGVAR